MSIDLTVKGYYYMARRGSIKQLERAQWEYNQDVKKKYEEWRKKFSEPAAAAQPRKLTWIDECGKGDLCATFVFSYNDAYELPRQPATEPDEEDTETEEEDD